MPESKNNTGASGFIVPRNIAELCCKPLVTARPNLFGLRTLIDRLYLENLGTIGHYSPVIWTAPLAALVLGYLFGSIPFGLLLTRFSGAGDLRAIGSGNIGATNVLRTGRKGLAALTLLLDAAKGAAAVLVARWIGADYALLGGLAAFLGHCYPIWLRFHGGKGVATFLGIALALSWPIGLIYAVIWLVVLGLFRYSSVGGMAAAVSAPVAAALWGEFEMAILFLALALLVLWKHRANIERLLSGDEPRVGQGKGESMGESAGQNG
jgi:glycerol-3-phosphate acyltransferase PlsY